MLREILARLFYFIGIMGERTVCFSCAEKYTAFLLRICAGNIRCFAKTYSAGKFYFKANINILLSFLQLKGGRFLWHLASAFYAHNFPVCKKQASLRSAICTAIPTPAFLSWDCCAKISLIKCLILTI